MKVEMGGHLHYSWQDLGGPLDALTISPSNIFTIPHLHQRSSDESDPGSPSGGYRGSHPPAHVGYVPDTGAPPSTRLPPEYIGPSQPFDEPAHAPPHRPGEPINSTPHHGPAHRRRNGDSQVYHHSRHQHAQVSPSGSQHSTASDRSASNGSYSDQTSGLYEQQVNLRQPAFPLQPAFTPDRYPAYDQNHRRIGLEHTRFGARDAPGGAPTHYRPQTLFYPTPNDQSLSPSNQYVQESTPSSREPATYSSRASSSSAQPEFPDAGDYLRQQLNLSQGDLVSLRSLPDPPPGERPNYSLPMLIKLAIYGSPRKQLTLQEIYAAIEERFEWFRERTNDKAWKSSIRHNLSLNQVFRHVARPITEPGKGSYWRLDISAGEGNKRARRRRPRSSRANRTAGGPDQEMSDESSPSPPPSGQSYTGVWEEENNIDPELRRQGHVVGEGRFRSSSTRRVAVGSPYPSSPVPGTPRQIQLAPIMDHRVRNASHSDSESVSPLDHSGSAAPSPHTDAIILPAPHSQMRFNGEPHPSFGRPAFGQSQQQPPRAQPAASPPANLPRAFLSTSSEVVTLSPAPNSTSRSTPRPPAAHDRNFPVVQPPPRPGVELILNDGGLPRARRVASPETPRPSHLSPVNSHHHPSMGTRTPVPSSRAPTVQSPPQMSSSYSLGGSQSAAHAHGRERRSSRDDNRARRR